jgi:HEAT repeat protein
VTPERQELVQALFGSCLPTAVAAAKSLSIPKDSHALSVLMKRVADAPEELCIVIIEALITLADSRAIPALVSCLRSDSEAVRGEALHAVIALSEQRASSLPHDLLNNADPLNPSRALTQIVFPADLEAIKVLHTHLSDQDPELRTVAAYGLGAMGTQSAAKALRRLGLSDHDEDVQTAASYALGQLVERGSTQALGYLKEIAQQVQKPEVLIATVRTLCFYQSHQHIDVFVNCLNHDDHRLRQLGLVGLGESKQTSVIPHLINGLLDTSSHVQRLAAHALGEVRSTEGIEAMIIAASKGSSELRTSVADALKKYTDQVLTPPLTRAAHNPQAPVRKAASYIAAKTGQLKICTSLLTDGDEVVRKQATLGLADLHALAPVDIIQAAFRALADPSWKVRVAGIESLSRIGDRAAIERLRELSDDANHVVKQAIRRTLAKF